MERPTHSPEARVPAHVADLVTLAAARVADNAAIVDVTSGVTLTWAELDGAVSAEAARLRAAGVASGDRVLVRLGNGAPFCVAVLGALLAGAVAVPFGPIAVARELEIVLGDCRPAVVVAAQGDDAAVTCAAVVDALVLAPPDLAARAERQDLGGGGEEIALLVYTSGTTGSPRGVRLSHRAVLANRAQTAALRPSPMIPVDRVLLSLPLFHIFGLAAGFLQACWAGATVVLTERFEPAHIAEVLLEQRVSGIAGVPSMFRSLLDLPADDLRTAMAGVRLCTSGGAPLPARWLADFHAATGLSISEGYGLTEAGPVLTTNGIAEVPKPGSVGRALPGVELRLVDAEGRPLDAPPARDVDDAAVDDADELDDDDELDVFGDLAHDLDDAAGEDPGAAEDRADTGSGPVDSSGDEPGSRPRLEAVADPDAPDGPDEARAPRGLAALGTLGNNLGTFGNNLGTLGTNLGTNIGNFGNNLGTNLGNLGAFGGLAAFGTLEDLDDLAADVLDPAQDTGLVSVRGPNLFSGYWPDGAGGPDEDGWFRTADVGFLDADGDLHLVDRSSDLVIVNGFNVYPREVEQVLAELPGVAEGAVVGVPDDRTGEAVKAVLVLAAGAELTEEEVRAHCVERLARFKVPAVIQFTDALPRTPTGKVARRQLAARS